MSTCAEIQKLLPVVAESVSADEFRRVSRHLEQCPICRSIQDDYLALDQASAQIDVPDPGEEYWSNFANRVQQRIPGESRRPRPKLIKWLVYRPVYSWPAAAAALVLVFFITRAMLPEGTVPEPEVVAHRHLLPVEKTEGIGPEMAEVSPGEEAIAVEMRAEPQEKLASEEVTTLAADNQQSPEVAALDIPPQPTTDRTDDRVPSYDPDQIPAEELQSVLTARERNLAQADLPERKTIILRGDTTQAELSDKDLPEGRDLELAERPKAPFPTDEDTGGVEGERVLGSQMGQDYTGYDRSYPALNKDDFTADDREFFEQRITGLTAELTKKNSDGKRRRLCRELVDMYCQLAINWKAEADIEAAREYIEDARDILREEDYADLDAKAGALKSLLQK